MATAYGYAGFEHVGRAAGFQIKSGWNWENTNGVVALGNLPNTEAPVSVYLGAVNIGSQIGQRRGLLRLQNDLDPVMEDFFGKVHGNVALYPNAAIDVDSRADQNLHMFDV